MKTCHAKDCEVRPEAMGFTVHTELIQRWDGV